MPNQDRTAWFLVCRIVLWLHFRYYTSDLLYGFEAESFDCKQFLVRYLFHIRNRFISVSKENAFGTGAIIRDSIKMSEAFSDSSV